MHSSLGNKINLCLKNKTKPEKDIIDFEDLWRRVRVGRNKDYIVDIVYTACVTVHQNLESSLRNISMQKKNKTICIPPNY